MDSAHEAGPTLAAQVQAIERPHPRLLAYYGLTSLFWGPLFFLRLIPGYLRYRSLRYRFDSEGISVRWGVLFRREINLTYARIQDIHLRSGVIERHLRLGRIEVQTASGNAKAEVTIEGLLEFEAVRDHLYAQMRGRDESTTSATETGAGDDRTSAEPPGHLAELLQQIAGELRELRRELREERAPGDRPTA